MRRQVAIEITKSAYDDYIRELEREGYEVACVTTGFDSEYYQVKSPDGTLISVAERCNGRCEVFPASFAEKGGNAPY